MIVSPYRTSITQRHQDGDKLAGLQPDMTRRSGPGNSKRYRKQESK